MHTIVSSRFRQQPTRFARIICVSTLVVAAIVAIGVRDAAASPIVSIDAPAAASVGQAFTVDVDITGAVDLYAFQLTVAFDPLLLAATGVQEGALLPAGGSTVFVPGIIDNGAGTIEFVADTLTGPAGVSGNGSLFSITFTALGIGSAAISTAASAANGDGLLDSTLAAIPGAALDAQAAVAIRAVPEPGALTLLGLGAVAAVRRSRGWRSRGGWR